MQQTIGSTTRVSKALGILASIALMAPASIQVSRASQPDIYPPAAAAKADLGAALSQAAATHKRVILDFGGNWCPDCHALDGYFHDAGNKPLLEAGFLLVHVNIGRLDENTDIAMRYHISLKKGVPALAVLDDHGALLYAQKTGEFKSMSTMQSSAVTEFLNRWKPANGG